MTLVQNPHILCALHLPINWSQKKSVATILEQRESSGTSIQQGFDSGGRAQNANLKCDMPSEYIHDLIGYFSFGRIT